MAARKKKSGTGSAEVVELELKKLLTRLSKPGVDRWEADTAKVRHLIALDAASVMKRIDSKQDEAVGLFSRLRTRDGMIELCRSSFTSVTFSELARLSPPEQLATFSFHEQLDAMRWYVSYTEDMPSTVKSTVSQYVRKLGELHRDLTTRIGPPGSGGHPVIEAEPSEAAS
ncbi:MAG: hypothetical protein JNM17_09555 [Archangium sp.]|nr:hypothetical protein [Archangium sp.]